MVSKKQVIAGPLKTVRRVLSLSRASRTGDVALLTGQIRLCNEVLMTEYTMQDPTRTVLDDVIATLARAGCVRDDLERTMVWLRDRTDCPVEPLTRSAVIGEFLVDVRCEVKVKVKAKAYRPLVRDAG